MQNLLYRLVGSDKQIIGNTISNKSTLSPSDATYHAELAKLGRCSNLIKKYASCEPNQYFIQLYKRIYNVLTDYFDAIIDIEQDIRDGTIITLSMIQFRITKVSIIH